MNRWSAFEAAGLFWMIEVTLDESIEICEFLAKADMREGFSRGSTFAMSSEATNKDGCRRMYLSQSSKERLEGWKPKKVVDIR